MKRIVLFSGGSACRAVNIALFGKTRLTRRYRDGIAAEAMKGNERAVGAVLKPLVVREEFPDHTVDAEYNRIGANGDPRRLNLPADFGTRNGRVIPDIIVHLRGDNNENLLVAELKMETNPQSRDHQKLQAFIEQLGYRVGVFIELPAGQDARERHPEVPWFPNAD